tara:strand:- start:157 stop:699 length:543 start_codon:yes stop_codon:yes gene_type:complete
MTAILKVDTIQDTAGNNIINENANTITIGKSGDTVNLASGATAGFGKVLQVVTATDSTQRSTTSTSFVTASSSLTVNITPSSTSNKILLMVSGGIYVGASATWGKVTIFKGGSNLLTSGGGAAVYNGGNDIGSPLSIVYLDNPSSTSQLTYDVRFLTQASSIFLNLQGVTSSIVAMEIGV